MQRIKWAFRMITGIQQTEVWSKVSDVLVVKLAELTKWDPLDLLENIAKYSWTDIRKGQRMTKKYVEAKKYFIEIANIERKVSMIRMWQQSAIIIAIIIASLILQLLFPDAVRGVSMNFYMVTAQIFPVVIVAIYLTNRSNDPSFFKLHTFTREKYLGFFAAFMGMLGSLWAVAISASIVNCFIFVVAGLMICSSVVFKAAVRN